MSRTKATKKAEGKFLTSERLFLRVPSDPEEAPSLLLI